MTIPDERRLVTVLFADLVGFTGRAEQRDPRRIDLGAAARSGRGGRLFEELAAHPYLARARDLRNS